MLNLLCAIRYFEKLGYEGRLTLRTGLDNLKSKKVFSKRYDTKGFSGQHYPPDDTFLFSIVDDSIEFERETDTQKLKHNLLGISGQILKTILFSLNEQEVPDDNEIQSYITTFITYYGINEEEVRKFQRI